MDYTTKNIRNVALLGHSGSGKTTFVESMLFEAKEISRRGSIDDKNTASDFTNIEKDRGNSIFTTLMHVPWKSSKINILDTPGSDDFVGEVVAALKVADTGVVLLNGKSGVEVGTELIWETLCENNTPSLFVINQLDSDKADYEMTLEQAKNRFGNHVIAVQFPYIHEGKFSIIDALRMIMYVFDENGGKPTKVAIPESEKFKAQELHNELVEVAAENEESLMEKFFEEGSLDEDELADGLRIAMANHEFFPVFCASGLENKGSGRIMGFISDICPSPLDRKHATLENGEELVCDDKDKTTIFIYKTMSEPRIGNVSYYKVASGILKHGDELVNATTRNGERFSQLFISNGKDRHPVDKLYAGDLGATVKLKNTHTNDTLNEKGVERKLTPIPFPEPRIRAAVVPENSKEIEKMMAALHTISMEDPTLVVEQSASLKQTILHGQGQLHLDIIKYRVEKVNNIHMNFEKPKISYRETITKMVNGSYRHKKQSGGAGQFGEVHMRIEPYYEGMPSPDGLSVRHESVEELPWGGKLAFLWCIVGGSIDYKYSNAIKKGVMQKMQEGPLTNSPCLDIRVCIYDGKMHPVDSNDMAFMLAASNVFKSNFLQAGPQLLEPIYDVDILCPSDAMGDIMGDLQTRRAMIQGMDADGHYQKITAKVPLAEMYQYSTTLRSISQGKAKFSRKFAEFTKVPHDIQQKLTQEEASANA